MQPSSRRRAHSAEFKAVVLAECVQPGASVAAVALLHGLNVNLVRKWLIGRGLKRAGLQAPRSVTHRVGSSAAVEKALPALQFVPVELAAAGVPPVQASSGVGEHADIHIELRRGPAQLTVRWPGRQESACAAWLSELAVGLLK